MLKAMKTYINKLQDGDNTAQLIGVAIGMVVLCAVILYMHSHGLVWFDKY